MSRATETATATATVLTGTALSKQSFQQTR